MTENELDRFRRMLEDLAGALEAELATPDSTASSITPDDAIGRLTRMEAIQAQAMGAAGRRSLEARLQGARRALGRIAQGTYGRCVRCGRDIPQGRLEVLPEAGRCVVCAARG